MNVKELMDFLKTCHPDAIVFINECEGEVGINEAEFVPTFESVDGETIKAVILY